MDSANKKVFLDRGLEPATGVSNWLVEAEVPQPQTQKGCRE